MLFGLSYQPSPSTHDDGDSSLPEDDHLCEEQDVTCSVVNDVASSLLDLASDSQGTGSNREPESVLVDNQVDADYKGPALLPRLQATSIRPEQVDVELVSPKSSAASPEFPAGAEAEDEDATTGNVLPYQLPENTVAPPVQKENFVDSKRSQTVSCCQDRTVEGPAIGVESESNDLAAEVIDDVQLEGSILRAPQRYVDNIPDPDCCCNVEAHQSVDGTTRSPKRSQNNDDSLSRNPDSKEPQNFDPTEDTSGADGHSSIDSLSGQQQNHAVCMKDSQWPTGWSTYVATGFSAVALVAAVVGLRTALSRK